MKFILTLVRQDDERLLQMPKRKCNYPLNTFTSSGLFFHNYLDRSISKSRMSGSVLLLPSSIEIPTLDANSVDPDQTPRSMASDLGLHCLQRSHVWELDINGLKFLIEISQENQYIK